MNRRWWFVFLLAGCGSAAIGWWGAKFTSAAWRRQAPLSDSAPRDPDPYFLARDVRRLEERVDTLNRRVDLHAREVDMLWRQTRHAHLPDGGCVGPGCDGHCLLHDGDPRLPECQ